MLVGIKGRRIRLMVIEVVEEHRKEFTHNIHTRKDITVMSFHYVSFVHRFKTLHFLSHLLHVLVFYLISIAFIIKVLSIFHLIFTRLSFNGCVYLEFLHEDRIHSQ